METLFTIIVVAIFVFGILEIILFFKVWGMTNNISKIKSFLFNNTLENNTKTIAEEVSSLKQSLPHQSHYEKYKFAILKGDKASAKEHLDNSLIYSSMKCAKESSNQKEFEKKQKSIIEVYMKNIDEFGLEPLDLSRITILESFKLK